MKNVIVTGADGFIGSYVVNTFARNGINVLALDIADKPRRISESSFVRYRPCNVFDADQTVRTAKNGDYDTFISLAWQGLGDSRKYDRGVQTKNSAGTAASVYAAAEIGCAKFIDIGSVTEFFLPPASVYSAAKKESAELCRRISAELSMEYIHPFLTNAYGPGAGKGFIWSMINCILNGEPLVFSSAVQLYDFVYVTDVAEALFLIAKKGKPSSRYIIGSGAAAQLKEFINEVMRICRCSREPQFGEDVPTGEMLSESEFDISAIGSECGFTPTVPFENGIYSTYEYMLREQTKSDTQ